MKNLKSRVAFVALFAGLTLSALAQETESRNLGNFDGVSAAEGIEVTLTLGSSNTASIKAKGVELDEVLTEIENGILKLHLEGNKHRNFDVEIAVTYTGTLESLKSSSASSIECNDWLKAGDFDVDVSSAGSIKAKVEANDIDIDGSSSGDVALEVKAGEISIDISSGSTIVLSGSCEELEAEASSGSTLKAYDLKVKDADLEVSSGANLRVTVDNDLEAKASSGGSISYKGNARPNIRSSSGGSVRKG